MVRVAIAGCPCHKDEAHTRVQWSPCKLQRSGGLRMLPPSATWGESSSLESCIGTAGGMIHRSLASVVTAVSVCRHHRMWGEMTCGCRGWGRKCWRSASRSSTAAAFRRAFFVSLSSLLSSFSLLRKRLLVCLQLGKCVHHFEVQCRFRIWTMSPELCRQLIDDKLSVCRS